MGSTAHAVTQTPVPAAVAKSLAVWHDILSRNAMEELDPILADEIVFRSPVAFTPYPGRAAIKLINPANKRKYSLIMVGSGLAGASGAASLADAEWSKQFARAAKAALERDAVRIDIPAMAVTF